MGLFAWFRPRPLAGSRREPIVHDEVLGDDVRWVQSFQWGLLIAHDDDAPWDVPGDVGKGGVAGNASCLAVPVRHAQDVRYVVVDDDDPGAPTPRVQVAVVLTTRPLELTPDYDGPFRCPSGRLQIGDAEEYRRVEVPPGDLRVQLWLSPEEHAERVVMALQRTG